MTLMWTICGWIARLCIRWEYLKLYPWVEPHLIFFFFSEKTGLILYDVLGFHMFSFPFNFRTNLPQFSSNVSAQCSWSSPKVLIFFGFSVLFLFLPIPYNDFDRRIGWIIWCWGGISVLVVNGQTVPAGTCCHAIPLYWTLLMWVVSHNSHTEVTFLQCFKLFNGGIWHVFCLNNSCVPSVIREGPVLFCVDWNTLHFFQLNLFKS